MDLRVEINKEIRKYLAMTGIGIVAFIIGNLFNIQTHILNGVAIGFIPTGLGMALVYHYTKKNPKLQQNFVLEREERNLFINNKTGYIAFWIVFWYIFVFTVFPTPFKMSVSDFGLVTMLFMSAIYFITLYINHRRF